MIIDSRADVKRRTMVRKKTDIPNVALSLLFSMTIDANPKVDGEGLRYLLTNGGGSSRVNSDFLGAPFFSCLPLSTRHYNPVAYNFPLRERSGSRGDGGNGVS